MTIRLLNELDKEQVLDLDNIVFGELDGGWTDEEFDYFFIFGSCFVFHEENKPNKLIGYIFSRQFKNCTYISNFAVKKEYEGRGIGTELLKMVMLKEQECSQNRSFSIELQVLSANKRALQLYERLGFKKTSHDDTWIQLQGTALPELFKKTETQKKTAVASEAGIFSPSSSSFRPLPSSDVLFPSSDIDDWNSCPPCIIL